MWSELAKCSEVSRTWKSLSSNNCLWAKLLNESPPKDKNINIKKCINPLIVKSIDEIVQRLREFVKKVPLNKKAEFVCYFPSIKDSDIAAVKFGYGKLCENSETDMKDSCIFFNKLQQDILIPKQYIQQCESYTETQKNSIYLSLYWTQIKIYETKIKIPYKIDFYFSKSLQEKHEIKELRKKISEVLKERIGELIETEKRQHLQKYLVTAASVSIHAIAAFVLLYTHWQL